MPENSRSRHATEPPPAPLIHVVAILAAVVAPAVGVVIAVASAWTQGWMGWFYLSLVVGGWLLTGIGITVGYHRLLTHRAFDTTRWVRVVLTGLGALALQEGPLTWSAVHRKHHRHSDDHGDPHSPQPLEGGLWNRIKALVWSHVGWMFTGHMSSPEWRRYVPDLLEDPDLVRIQRHYYTVWVPLTFLVPAAAGGVWTGTWEGFWLGLLWGGLVRVFVGHHITWSVNSVCHLLGRRDFATRDHSRNNLVCALLSHGEGWHNNHHAFPASARHGLLWWQVDLGYLVIRALEAMGLAWNVNRPPAHALERKRLAP